MLHVDGLKSVGCNSPTGACLYSKTKGDVMRYKFWNFLDDFFAHKHGRFLPKFLRKAICDKFDRVVTNNYE